MENGGFLFAAYAVVWAVLFGYVLFLGNRQDKAKRELEQLKEMLKDKSGK
jgi:CcmD family protein